ncbi:inverse autotransporter beta domain-containing protein, partial [Xenorhabdus bovienii]|uniref:inverse autotransporter beta domain-containing protein n=1 Tax=Xenorhabdus bovienii TaxID=40576 RepID=UPI0023B2966B
LLNYRFGTPFSVQMAPDSVASMRTLAGSRYDLVERNNNIVLDYRQKSDLTVNLPNTLSGYGAQNVPLTAMITSSKPVKNIRCHSANSSRPMAGPLLMKPRRKPQSYCPSTSMPKTDPPDSTTMIWLSL